MIQIKFINVCVIVACLVNASRLVHCASRASSQIKRYTIRRDMDTSIVSNSYTVNSWLECSAKCTEDQSVSLYYTEGDKRCQCNNDIDRSTPEQDDPSKQEVVYGEFERFIKISKIGEVTQWTMFPPEQDCLDIYQSGFSDDGIYNIKPSGQKAVDTWCDMQNGGWTVVQRRSDGSEDFYRGWSDYVAGFGNRTSEYWLGLDSLHALTIQTSELHIYAEAFAGTEPLSGYAYFSTVYVNGPSSNYRLVAGGYSGGPCLDPFETVFNNREFSTFDRDNDGQGWHCAKNYKGSWWYEGCYVVNLNGYYYSGPNLSGNADGITWVGCWSPEYSVKKTLMKVRRT